MSIIELIPLDKGHRLTLDPTIVTTIGRTPNIGCLDKKISRNHAEIFVKSDGTLWIKPIHNNPTFFKSNDGQLITLTKDQEHQLKDSDQIGLLPTEYFYRISIQTNEPSAIPKTPEEKRETVRSPSPVQRRSESPKFNDETVIEDSSTREPEGGIILHTKRALPSWMSNAESVQSKTTKERGKGKTTTATTTPVKTPSPSKYRTYIGRKKVEGINYDDDDDDEDDEEKSNGHTASSRTNSSITIGAKTSTKREKCPYGKFCYRKNPLHRQEAIHPGDPDWNDKENENDDEKPECPYGSDCYRKNPDHHKQYSHPKKTKTKKRRSSDDDEEDDDDGLPNEYDYNDSFINDDELQDSMRNDRAVNHRDDPDQDWKPHHKARPSHRDDNGDESSTDDSEFELLRQEAAEFAHDASTRHSRPAKKKAKLNLHDPEEE